MNDFIGGLFVGLAIAAAAVMFSVITVNDRWTTDCQKLGRTVTNGKVYVCSMEADK